MDDHLNRAVRRWMESEQEGREAEADAALTAALAEELRRPAASPDFAARTMAAVSAAMVEDARRARRTRRAAIPAAVVIVGAVAYAGAPFAVSALSFVVTGTLDFLVSLVVRVATTMPAGADVWTVMANLGRVAASVVASPVVATTILAIQGIALAALLALHRLLGSDGESVR